jgi:RHS repeat-associated protein
VAGTFATVLPGNFNDDSCTDLYSGPTIAIAGCNGGNPVTYSTGTSSPIVAALDWDGDGRTDMLVSSGSLYRSEATQFAPAVASGISIGSGSWAVTDQNGDGLDDLAFANTSLNNAIYYGLHNGAGSPPDLATSFTDGYGNSANPAYSYLTQGGSLYLEFADAVFPYYKNYVGPLYVVSKTTFSDPSNEPSGTFTQTMSYFGAWLNIQGRGFSGFNDIGNLDSRNGVWEVKWFRRDFPFTGVLSQDWISQPNTVATFSVETNNSFPTLAAATLDATANNQRYFPYVSNSISKFYELGGNLNGQLITTMATNWTYDSYGNATTVATTLTNSDPTSPPAYLNATWTTVTSNTITPNTSQSWCVNLPTETTVTNSSSAPGGAAITRTVQYKAPDYLHCRETEKVTEPSSALYKVTEDYTYDPATGNFTKYVVTGVNMAARSTNISWNSTAQFPVTVTNPLTQSITLAFDPSTGHLTSVSDPNSTTSNPLATTWTYDNFGRKILETRLDGTSTAWAYNSCATAGCVNANNKVTVTATVKKVGGSTLTTRNTYLDSLERLLVSSSMMLNGAYDRQEVQYDNLGRLQNQGAPSTFTAGTAYWTTYGYDALNRLTSVQRPTSAMVSTPVITEYLYQGRTTTITDPPTKADPSGRVTSKITLPSGLLAQTQDNSGYNVNFGYDAFGSLLSVVDNSSPANTLFTASYAYGIGAFQVSSTDADLGKRTRVYDALGELTSYIDAKGQSFSFLYDALSRPTQRAEPDPITPFTFVTNWTWGNSAASSNIGKLQSVSATSSPGTYSESYTYDSKTRPSTTSIVIPGDTTYTYTQTYNSTTGLLDTLQYPISTASYQMKLQYGYINGILQNITDISPGGPGTVYWAANTMNPAGQVLQETLGNGVLVNHAFDAVTAQLQTIQAGVGGGAVLQNNTYQFDAVGNLIQRQDANAGVTENVYPDALYRLDHTVGDSSTAMSYDAMGRISAWGASSQLSNVNDYTTPQSGCTYYTDHAQPHAVRSSANAGSSFSPNAFCYDANGNMLSQTNPRGSTTAVWTGFNQPSSITGALGSSQFYYDANHQRFMQQAIYSGAVENTIYIGGLLEKMSNSSGTAYRHYIPAGNNTVVYTRLNNGTNSTYYMTQDHLGSTAVITDQTGNSVIKEQFAALGWPESSTSVAGTVSRHEFTGQEDLDNVFMVNMNGRVYQPSGGYFLSPDPFVPDPSNTQSFNRYSYVNNNPLSLVDPSGYDDQPPSNGQDPLDEIQVEGLRMGAGDTTSAYASSARTSFGEVFFTGPIPQTTIFGGGRSFGQPPSAGLLDTPTFDLLSPTVSLGDFVTPNVNIPKSSGSSLRAAIVNYFSNAFSPPRGPAPNVQMNYGTFFPPISIGGAAVAVVAAARGTATGRALVTYFPTSNGFLGATTQVTLETGQVIDRYGGTAISRFFSPAGTPLVARSLPADTAAQALRSFQVVKPFAVEAGKAVPAFGQLGLGTQFRTAATLEELLDQGFLQEISP